MMEVVVPKPEFVHLTEEEIFDRLDAYEDTLDEDSDEAVEAEDVEIEDPVVAEVERLIDGYTDQLDTYCREHAEIPDDALLYSPASAIERVAFQIFTEALHDSLMDEDDEE